MDKKILARKRENRVIQTYETKRLKRKGKEWKYGNKL